VALRDTGALRPRISLKVFRITSTIKPSVLAPNTVIARSSCASAIAVLGGDIVGIRRKPTRTPLAVVNVPNR
jgi:hypothetical protein